MQKKQEIQKVDKQNQEYLSLNVNDIIEPMMIEVVKNNPDDYVRIPVPYLPGQVHGKVP